MAVCRRLSVTLPAGLDGFRQGFLVKGGRQNTGPFNQSNGIKVTSAGADTASDATVQIHFRPVFITHGQGLGWAPIDTDAAGCAETVIMLGFESGIQVQPGLRLGQCRL